MAEGGWFGSFKTPQPAAAKTKLTTSTDVSKKQSVVDGAQHEIIKDAHAQTGQKPISTPSPNVQQIGPKPAFTPSPDAQQTGQTPSSARPSTNAQQTEQKPASTPSPNAQQSNQPGGIELDGMVFNVPAAFVKGAELTKDVVKKVAPTKPQPTDDYDKQFENMTKINKEQTPGGQSRATPTANPNAATENKLQQTPPVKHKLVFEQVLPKPTHGMNKAVPKTQTPTSCEKPDMKEKPRTERTQHRTSANVTPLPLTKDVAKPETGLGTSITAKNQSKAAVPDEKLCNPSREKQGNQTDQAQANQSLLECIVSTIAGVLSSLNSSIFSSQASKVSTKVLQPEDTGERADVGQKTVAGFTVPAGEHPNITDVELELLKAQDAEKAKAIASRESESSDSDIQHANDTMYGVPTLKANKSLVGESEEEWERALTRPCAPGGCLSTRYTDFDKLFFTCI